MVDFLKKHLETHKTKQIIWRNNWHNIWQSILDGEERLGSRVNSSTYLERVKKEINIPGLDCTQTVFQLFKM